MKNIQAIEEFQALIRGEMPFCAVFSADWCKDCLVIKTVLKEIEEEYRGKYTFAVVDRDKFIDICHEYDVLGIPSFIIFKSGKALSTFISSRRKTRKEITDFLDNAAAGQ
ncbi:MAG: hypothetical protein B0D92_04310 [Spirochaeta sp. LUC14_002_19_P3]|nr:MAG: hypothetical protein B0D92_04310 [Spirochaeta sp. LUC14_002_19_P3]